MPALRVNSGTAKQKVRPKAASAIAISRRQAKRNVGWFFRRYAMRKRDIVAIADAGLGGVGRHHAMTGIVEQQPGQQMIACVPCRGSGGPLLCKFLLDRIE